MLKVVNNNIYLTRGDSAEIELSIMQDGKQYTLEDGDIVEFTVKKNVYSDILIKKQLLNNILKLIPEDTNFMCFGNYLYDIQITTTKKDVYTIIGPCQFVIEKEVNSYG